MWLLLLLLQLVKIHGGPTSAATTLLSLSYQYWTSRGFAIADVNCGECFSRVT
jgi:dipeptidyl aminopeptidase/acylaminoacyl peptidase